MEHIILPSRSRGPEELLSLSTPTAPALGEVPNSRPNGSIKSPQDVLALLKSKPDVDALRFCLEYLCTDGDSTEIFNVRRPGPLASQIIFVLVNDIVPSYWEILSQTPSQRKSWQRLIQCLRSNAGIAATTQRLKLLSSSGSAASSQVQQSVSPDHIQAALELLECLLHGNDMLHALWVDIVRLESQNTKRLMLADGFAGLVASGNVLSIAAQADTILREKSKDIRKESWVGHGREYASWLGRNILHLSRSIRSDDIEVKRFRTDIISKALRLGQSDIFIGAIFFSLLEGSAANLKVYNGLLDDLPAFMRSTALNVILRLLAEKSYPGQSTNFVSGAASLLKALVQHNGSLSNHLVSWLTDFVGGNVGFPLDLFRSVLLVVSEDLQRLKRVFETSLEQFGSKYAIQQEPMLQQEVRTKILLLTAGYIHGFEAEYLTRQRSSSVYLNAISNRLAASSARLQFFGMVVGMAISGLVDSQDSALKFDTDEIKGEEGERFRGLVSIRDSMGVIADLRPLAGFDKPRESVPGSHTRKRSMVQPVDEVKSKIVAIEEITGSESESEDDLPVYAKPDSDPEDSDDDPTTLNRNRPTAPVYIRDLLSGLRADDNYDRYKLAIEHAPALIRRKTTFGNEVSDHLEELAARLVGLRDSFNLDIFQRKRLQAMIAVIAAKPVEMGKWFANTYFNGDYSMSQRAAILSALAFSARELAGLKDEDAEMTGVNEVPDFPTKRLPEKYAKIYQLEAAPVDKLVGELERDIIKPMALEAADKATGPNILKVRTFSSRMEVEKKRKRAIPNELAKVVADGFFYPLTGRWSSVVRARGDSSVFTTPFLLSQFLRTLALILSASGTSTLSLPGMTMEFWGLLLSLRRFALTEQSVLEALLFANLTLLEINSNDQRRLAEDHAQELMETQAWVQPVFENLRGGPKEEERVKMLASALLIMIKEIIEGYQQSLMGSFVRS